MSTIKRRLNDHHLRGFITRCKPLVNLKNRKARLQFTETHKKKPAEYGLMKKKSTSIKMMEKGKYREKDEQLNNPSLMAKAARELFRS